MLAESKPLQAAVQGWHEVQGGIPSSGKTEEEDTEASRAMQEMYDPSHP